MRETLSNILRKKAQTARWQFWIDRGGTFTDIVARRPSGALSALKLLSEGASRKSDAVIEGIRRAMDLAPGSAIPTHEIECVRIGTTVATNALLTRSGEATVLAITRGFGDALRIGYQNRPRLFDLNIVLPEQLYSHVIELDERIGAHGEVERALDERSAERALATAYAEGLRSIAIVCMHAYRYPQHEQRIGAIARAIGYTQVSLSDEISPLMKLVGRGDTTVADAYLSPLLRRYIDSVAAQLPGTRVQFMQSNGGLADARSFSGKDAILSGPAGGVIGAINAAQEAGYDRIIGFDMGGTSTDVCHYSGEIERQFETHVAGVRLRTPMMAIHTVAAGGGSILHFDGARMRVGPDSAGAYPGPACYGRGGPLTITDCNVLLGRIRAQSFPRVFGANGDAPIDTATVHEQFARLAREISAATRIERTPQQIAEGFINIAVNNMASAIKRISIARGHDVTQYALCCFGGAAGQHACLVADALGIETVFIHPLASLLSAYGIGMALLTVMRERSVEQTLSAETLAGLKSVYAELEAQCIASLVEQGADANRCACTRRIHLRYAGTDTAIALDAAPLAELRASFERTYQQRYSFLMSQRALIIEAVAVEAIDDALKSKSSMQYNIKHNIESASPKDTPHISRSLLVPNTRLTGPALITEEHSTTVVEPGWHATVNAHRHLILTRTTPRTQREAAGTHVDPVMLEVFNNLFMSIAEDMGARLQQTAYSVNIKERLDFSCALFDAHGNLIANAPHMPVHLGSMSESVRAVMRDNAGQMKPGDSYMLNDPYRGGTHLPDVTVITPVFDEPGNDILFYVGSRGHHADIGGITPGSMPPASRHIEEEGVLITNFKVVERAQLRETETLALLRGAKYPARNPEQNLADLRAQLAANAKGVEELRRMVENYGLDTVRAYMQHVQDNAEECVRRVIAVLKDSEFTLEMDNGAKIQITIRVNHAQRSATIDFTGTSEQQDNNFNAPRAVTMAAVLYVFRCMVADDIPLNAGCLKPLEIIVPEGCMLNPRYPAAVVAGNVETSQCITNALFGALGVMAASCGTMSNFTFGNDKYQYYETIAGGSGAGPTFDGTDVVQTHMTNSRLTDPEVLEFRFPVRLESYAIRESSGGAGKYRGGNGGVRRIRFLEPMTAAILSGNRRVAPFGINSGAPGKPGHNYVQRADGSVVELSACGEISMEADDEFIVETPGGGGFG